MGTSGVKYTEEEQLRLIGELIEHVDKGGTINSFERMKRKGHYKKKDSHISGTAMINWCEEHGYPELIEESKANSEGRRRMSRSGEKKGDKFQFKMEINEIRFSFSEMPDPDYLMDLCEKFGDNGGIFGLRGSALKEGESKVKKRKKRYILCPGDLPGLKPNDFSWFVSEEELRERYELREGEYTLFEEGKKYNEESSFFVRPQWTYKPIPRVSGKVVPPWLYEIHVKALETFEREKL